jgi:SAM-dependent methyltransferase
MPAPPVLAPPAHPAKFSPTILVVLGKVLTAEARRAGHPLTVLDPMAGVGRIHSLEGDWATTGVELEPEWADQHPRTQQGDATALAFPDGSFDVVCTSPAYGSRMADGHEAKDSSHRITYKHMLGRPLSPNSGAALQWGQKYRDLHQAVLAEMVRVVAPGGLVVVNISDHIRAGVTQPVSRWWAGEMRSAGLKIDRRIKVPTPRMRFGQNHQLRVAHEWVFVGRNRAIR